MVLHIDELKGLPRGDRHAGSDRWGHAGSVVQSTPWLMACLLKGCSGSVWCAGVELLEDQSLEFDFSKQSVELGDAVIIAGCVQVGTHTCIYKCARSRR